MVQKNCIKDRVIVICGPTASGKSALSVALAKKIDGEIISADSLYVYKDLNIGTAKPSEKEMDGIKHYMIDVVSPQNSFSVGDYKEMAEPIVRDILNRSKVPIICGGTGFYINSLLFDISYGNISGNLEVREKYKKMADEMGNEAVFEVLKQVDPLSAEKLHYNDIKRVIRALEIAHSGVKKSEINDSFKPIYDYLAYSIDFDRETLYNRINTRVDSMIQNGLIEEVQNLISQGITIDNQCMQGIGYKEIYAYLNGESTLDEAVEQLKLNSRHYAKRQITFFKKLKGLQLLDVDTVDNLAKRIIDDYDRR